MAGKAVVLGAGRSGNAAAALLRHDGCSVCVLNGEDAWPDGSWDVCVTSPGVPPCHPWQNAARRSGVPVVSELQLGVERYRAIGGRMIAVTGSKGKSSVVKLVADALGGIPCGNYGTPVCEVALNALRSDGGDPAWAVVEVSSFQMETTELPTDAFEAAAILNLQEDHIDRHGSIEIYHALKRKLLGFARIKVEGYHLARSQGDVALLAGSYFDNPILQDNGLCAILLMRAAGLREDAIRNAFARFEPLPHRMQTIGTIGGVTWIDDSKATSISALVAGVTMAASRFHGAGPNVHLIAGGLPKGDDIGLASDCLARNVKKAYLIGQSAAMMEEAWRGSVPCEVCGELSVAVESAAQSAHEGDCVLLSPGTASFDQFKNYAERGERFAELIPVNSVQKQ